MHKFLNNESFINKFMPKIRFIASSLRYKTITSILDFEDLISYGIIGLLKAKNKYKENKKANFSTFSEFYIKGEMLDALRSIKWHSRSVGQNLFKIKKAYEFLEIKLNRKVEEEEVAKYLKITLDQFYQDMNIINISNFEDLIKEDKYKSVDIMESIPNDKISLDTYIKNKELCKLISNLSNYDQNIIILYFYYDYKMKEIAKCLNKTEANISIRIKKILKYLREIIEGKTKHEIILKDLTKKVKLKKYKIIKTEVKEKQSLSIHYIKTKEASVGEIIKCITCEKEFIKKFKRHIFCSNSGIGNCKDKYWSKYKKNGKC